MLGFKDPILHIKIMLKIINYLKSRVEDCIFIDNSMEKLKTANSLGMDTILIKKIVKYMMEKLYIHLMNYRTFYYI